MSEKTVRLYVPNSIFNVPNASPFCLKVEAFLNLANIKYKRVHCGDPGKGPKGKIPFIKHGDKTIGDSADIINYCIKAFGFDPDVALTNEQRAEGQAYTDTIEEGIYWAIVYSRWIDTQLPLTIKDLALDDVPGFMRGFVFKMIQRKIRRDMHGQGTGRHEREDIYARNNARIDAVADWLGDKSTALGTEAPTTMDCTLYATVANLVASSHDSPLTIHAKARPNLIRYYNEMSPRLGFEPNKITA